MKVIWAPAATQDRRDIWNAIRSDSPQAARRMDSIFSAAAIRLARHPAMGQPGQIEGTREFFPHRSYRLVYRISGNTVVMLALIHAARSWPPEQG